MSYLDAHAHSRKLIQEDEHYNLNDKFLYHEL